MANIFTDPTKSVPRSDSQIVRVPFEKMDLMNSTMPTPKQSPDLGIRHVPNAGNGNGR
jgi:hypothetical protein